ncbi:hypothetical protein BGX21_008806 [Mortierella sp. AD011]|nr:hypothetical protein BGX21_008806 [Mortierella sp. AD011]
MSASSSKSYRERPSKAPATVLLDHSSIDESVSNFTRRNSSPSGSDILLTAVVPGRDDKQSPSSRSQFQRDTSCESAGSSKHHRKAVTMKEKLDVIYYSETRQEMSVADVARYFRMNRTTVSGILKDKVKIRSRANLANLEARRVSKLSSSPVNNNKSQGRLLDCMLQVPRKPKMDVEPTGQPEPQVICGPRPGLVSPSVERRRQFLSDYRLDDIYTFGLTRKYIGKVDCHDCRDGSICSESSTLLILLCANASGTYKEAVPVIVNQNSIILKSEAWNGEVIYDKCSYLCSSTFQNWLSCTDMAFQRKVKALLVVDNTTCDLLKTDMDSPDLPILYTDIMGISSGQSSPLQNAFKSMNSELEKLFNGQYITSWPITGPACSSNEQYSAKDFEEQIQKAWKRIPDEVIRAPIQEFVREVYSSQALCDSRSPRSLNGMAKPGVEQYKN